MIVPTADPIWEAIRNEAAEETRKEPLLANFLYGVVLNHKTFEDALSFILATKLESTTIHAVALRDLIDEALVNDPEIGAAARADIEAVRERDRLPDVFNPLLFFGFHAIQCTDCALHWRTGRESLALFLQGRFQVLAVDIIPPRDRAAAFHGPRHRRGD